MITWDQVGERTYQNGLDRGVLYLSDGSGVAWNGLVSVVDNTTKTVSEAFYDGQKIYNFVQPSEFSGTLKAITYPEEFLEYDGFVNVSPGVFVAEQIPKTFGLSYRTHLGNDVNGDSIGYKIHVIYNLLAVPSAVTNATRSLNTSLVEFEWTLSATPEEYWGIRPTAHIIFDSRTLLPETLTDLETLLYGDELTEATLPSFETLMDYVTVLVKIVDNGDGTWTASTRRAGVITIDGFGEFEINEANATFLDAETYEITDTLFYVV